MPGAAFECGPEFRRLVSGDNQADLTRIALEIARDAEPALNAARTLAKFDEFADRVRERCRSGAGGRHLLQQINSVLFTEEGLRGNSAHYDDPRNSYLNQVLDRKLGIPISLSIVYLAVADRIGLLMKGVNLPYHFVICTIVGRDVLFVDPFHDGAILDRAGCRALAERIAGQRLELRDDQFEPCTHREIVLRMLRNLKALHARGGDFRAAVPVLRRLAALDPNDPAARRDLGIALVKANFPGEAIGHLEIYIKRAPDAQDLREITALLLAARGQVAAWN